ncbi:metallophosphoesterase [Halobellus ruber]|uniref:Metallophosphoesterase n=1 Tax=Halobellus ruber TaxID=2761102 RepID=A0A7J9SIE1_9EURY|nr:metallophosphoesterase [Halobellus ruber]
MDGVTFHRRGVFLPDAATLVVADLHVGRGEASNVTLPLGERTDLVDRLGELLAETEPETVVFAGDVLHRFDGATERARDTVDALVDACRGANARPEFVRGNHDTVLDDLRGDVDSTYAIDGGPRTVVCHGHELPDVRADRYVIGHDHPTITIEGQRHPCFLVVPETHRGADVLMLPAFSRLAPGVTVNDARGGDLQSPLVDSLSDARPIVYDADAGSTLRFPSLSEFRRLL